jgi:SNF family Na+-dependent transporter
VTWGVWSVIYMSVGCGVECGVDHVSLFFYLLLFICVIYLFIFELVGRREQVSPVK